MIEESTKVLLVEAGGKKHLVKAERRMIDLGGQGIIDGSSLCDSDIGSKLRVGSREFTVLRPSLRDLLGLMERRAQIMIPKDSFQIPLHLDVGCGDRVLEGGVGSGALTLVLLKSVGPSGKVVSYEVREDHANLARKNVAMCDNATAWELRMEDICKANLDRGNDAAVLDIPNPWDALENVSAALKVGGHVCCYVPNANQLEQCVRRMRELKLADVYAFETLQREMVVHDGGIRPSFDMLGHSGYMAFGRRVA